MMRSFIRLRGKAARQKYPSWCETVLISIALSQNRVFHFHQHLIYEKELQVVDIRCSIFLSVSNCARLIHQRLVFNVKS